MSVRTVYMCGVDWQYHLTDDPQGTTVYCSIADLKREQPCWEECGIVEATFTDHSWLVEQDLLKNIRKKRKDKAKEGECLPSKSKSSKSKV